MGAPVKKLLNFFERFHEACKGKKHHHKLIDIMQEVLVCDNEDEVFAVYPMILNQVKFAFDFLENNTRQNAESLEKVRSHMENCVNQSRASLYKTLSENNQDPKKYPIYLDHNIFELFKSFAIIDLKEEKDIDSLFSGNKTTALLNSISGIDDFELIAFLVIQDLQQ